MPLEQRVITPQKIGGPKPATSIKPVKEEAVAAEEPAKRPRGRRALAVVGALVVVALLGAGAAWWWLGRDSEPAPPPPPEPGEVMQIDPISINLANGRYLRLGLGLQLTADAGGHGAGPDASIALDHAISLYSGRDISEVADPVTREELKQTLAEQLEHAYHGEVMDVYLREFVYQ
ncbi:flagellar basal body rod protein [Xylanimonas oleitrophica]|uniref:Flagellar protein FliL n=1 Tax=Xylanimonas oleitrophica TaxID=2607479 RepID=A0A2W5X0D9_9MICO|nr:flagellar basal body-associated FliL family protein [Xylanimonas oleitrophica]PZR54136.1 flagellar basal body rod protein [Xylanimonas oleitrophica]